ncbi:hypothetical protein [Flagellimonas ruestringensis]|uniref:hypothetical protein n=1 Tax=Flagellimonas ruestringensis TaxID=111501 RepID=UPI00030DF341
MLYGVTYHICPTINSHDEVSVIENGKRLILGQLLLENENLRFKHQSESSAFFKS